MRSHGLLFALVFGICAQAFAAPLSLVQLVDIALENNPETKKAWANTKRAEAVVGVAESSYYPRLDGTAGATHAREVKFPNGPNTTFTNYSGELCLSYLLYDFGERSAAVKATKEALKAANWSSDFTMQQIIYKVASSYYEYLNAQELLEVSVCSLKDAQLVLDSAEDLHLAGLRSQTDLSTSRAEIAEIELHLARQKAKVAIAYGRLMTNLGISVTSSMEVDTQPKEIDSELFLQGIGDLIALADKQRTDLLAKKATLQEMRQRVKVANRARLPKLRALGQTGWLEYTKNQGNGYNYSAGVAMDVPIFRGFEFTYRKRLALANEEMTSAELTQLEQEIAQEVLTYSEWSKAAREGLKWSSEYLEAAALSYSSAIESYKAGLHSIFDLIQSQRALADARMKRAQVRTEWLVSLAQLAFATGSILE